MWKKSKPATQPVSPSSQDTYAAEEPSKSTQLSSPERVNPNVSSVALNYGLPAVGVRSNAAASDPVVSDRVAGDLTDAEVMLRVKAGDDSAFNFLAQKYRRPIINFMYRM